MHRAAEFLCRAASYDHADGRVCDRTRFFGAAAFINHLFAVLFRSPSAIVSDFTCSYLNDLGRSLATINASQMHNMNAFGCIGDALDATLVCSEQRAAQVHWQNYTLRAPQRIVAIRAELDGLLNGRHTLSHFAPLFVRSRDFSRCLLSARREVGTDLQFGNEFHRVRVGLALIRHLRAWSSDRESPRSGEIDNYRKPVSAARVAQVQMMIDSAAD